MCFLVVIKQLVSDVVLCLDVSVANRTYYKTDDITVNYGTGIDSCRNRKDSSGNWMVLVTTYWSRAKD